MKKFLNFRSLLSRPAPSLLLPSLCVATSLMVQGCPAGGTLENKDAHLADDGPCDPTPIFARCSDNFCHQTEDGMAPAGGVDFFAPGFGQAMLDMPATYPGVTDPDNCPSPPELILNSANLSESLLLKKVYHTHSCGAAMPAGPSLPEIEIECLESWAASIIAGGGSGTGGANPGTGGADGTGGEAPGTGGDMMGTGGDTAMPMSIKIEAECVLGTNCNGITASADGEVMAEADGMKVGYLDAGDALIFENINVEGLNEVTFNFAKGNETAGSVEIRLGTAEGMLVGTFTPTSTGAWDMYTDATVALSQTLTGTQTIVLVFTGGTSVCNIDWFEFSVGAAAL